MKNIITLILIICTYANVYSQKWDEVEIKAQMVSDQIYMLEGAGGNIGVFTGPDGTLMIDSQFAPLSEKIKAAIQELSDSSIVYLVNTHWHGDHTGGNENFGKDGTTIVAHNKVRERLTTENVRPFRGTTPPAPEMAWPTITFNDEMNLHINGESLHLFHVHNAHTDGDSFIYFPKANVLHMGDCFFKDRFPFIDTALGGSVAGAITAVEKAIMICDEETKIIPGHGSLASIEDLRRYFAMLNTMNDRVRNVSTSESTVEDLNIESLTEGYEDWGGGFINGETFVKTLLNDLYKDSK